MYELGTQILQEPSEGVPGGRIHVALEVRRHSPNLLEAGGQRNIILVSTSFQSKTLISVDELVFDGTGKLSDPAIIHAVLIPLNISTVLKVVKAI